MHLPIYTVAINKEYISGYLVHSLNVAATSEAKIIGSKHSHILLDKEYENWLHK